ncbi:MAG TPA: transcriptional regulator [Clostridiales bacterium]|nr:transcriptional regulator [Clostridiales bacterium]
MDKDLLLVAQDDKLGRTIQDLNLPTRRRARKTKTREE